MFVEVYHTGQLELRLNDWQSAGLLKPSVARLDRLVTAERTVLIRRLGMLSPTNLASVQLGWKTHMKL